MSESINHDAYRAYHASRFDAAALACVSREAAPDWPASPPAPLVCRRSIDSCYRQIVTAQSQADAAWQEVLAQASSSADLVDRLIEALVSRDVPRIKLLAPQLAMQVNAQRTARSRLTVQQTQVQQAVDALKRAWTKLWPGQDLSFDFERAEAAASGSIPGAVSSEELPALRHYHEATYTRLAMTYLGYAPAAKPDPEPALPASAGELDRSLKQLEATLRARYDLDQAIELDTAQLDEIAQAGLLPKDWSVQALDPVKYSGQRASAALARLKLFKLADTLVTECLDLQQREVDWQWRRAWPQLDVTTDIRAFAKLKPVSSGATATQPSAPADSAPDPNWSSFTFRE